MRNAIYNKQGIKIAGAASLPAQLDKAVLDSALPLYTDGIFYSVSDEGEISAVELPEETVRVVLSMPAAALSKEKQYISLLTTHMNMDELVNTCKRLHYKFEHPRVVITISLLNPSGEMDEILSQVFQEQDASIVAMSKQKYAVIYDLNDNFDEVGDLCIAIRDTIINELQTDAQIGIGERVGHAGKLSDSYHKSLEAIAIGSRIDYRGGVWDYNHLLPEILLSEVPKTVLDKYAELNLKMQSVMDADTELLMDELFKQNLNISKTAKQLFMHRNTLIYRLDKLQKATGLNVSIFEDAVTLRLFLALYKLNRN